MKHRNYFVTFWDPFFCEGVCFHVFDDNSRKLVIGQLQICVKLFVLEDTNHVIGASFIDGHVWYVGYKIIFIIRDSFANYWKKRM